MKYPSIPLLEELREEDPAAFAALMGSDVYVFEKMDGGNVQVRKDSNGSVDRGLRSGKVDGSTIERVPWAEEFEKYFWTNRERFQRLVPGTYFGEFTIPADGEFIHVEYSPEFLSRFFLIDVAGEHNRGLFLPYEQAARRVKAVSDIVHTAPLVYRGKLDEGQLEKLLYGKSEFSNEG